MQWKVPRSGSIFFFISEHTKHILFFLPLTFSCGKKNCPYTQQSIVTMLWCLPKYWEAGFHCGAWPCICTVTLIRYCVVRFCLFVCSFVSFLEVYSVVSEGWSRSRKMWKTCFKNALLTAVSCLKQELSFSLNTEEDLVKRFWVLVWKSHHVANSI